MSGLSKCDGADVLTSFSTCNGLGGFTSSSSFMGLTGDRDGRLYTLEPAIEEGLGRRPPLLGPLLAVLAYVLALLVLLVLLLLRSAGCNCSGSSAICDLSMDDRGSGCVLVIVGVLGAELGPASAADCIICVT